MTAQTPIYGLKYLVQGEPARNTRQALEENAFTIEAALQAGGVAAPGAGDVLAVSGRVSTLESRPVIMLTGNVGDAAPMTSGAWTKVPLKVKLEDTDGTGFAVDQARIPRAGLYLASALAAIGANTTGRRGARLTVNGASPAGIYQGMYPTTATGTFQAPTPVPVMRFAAGALVALEAFQDSGASLNHNPSLSFLALTWIRP